LGSPRRPSNTLPPTWETWGAASFSHSLLRLQEPFVSPWCSCFIKIFLMCDGTVTTFLWKSTVGSTISIIISLIAIVAANKRILRKCENCNYA
jgi:heme exporter protein D